VSGAESHLVYVPGGGDAVGWMPGPKDVLGVLHVLSGRKTVNFEAFVLADVMFIGHCQLNKMYFMQYYTESNINVENPDLTINKH
jgi:hypothetical protein